jgi:ElaB/YqjD/DUF883 family membrane-anchored ribosome-binding protein
MPLPIMGMLIGSAILKKEKDDLFNKEAKKATEELFLTNINKLVEDYVLRLNEYVTLFPGKPTLSDFGVDNSIETLSKKLKTSIAKKELFDGDALDVALADYINLALAGVNVPGINEEQKALLKATEDAAKENALKLKECFTAELGKINAALKEKIAEAKKEHEAALAAADTTDDTVDALKSGIVAVEKQIEWLAGYTCGLDSVLEI